MRLLCIDCSKINKLRCLNIKYNANNYSQVASFVAFFMTIRLIKSLTLNHKPDLDDFFGSRPRSLNKTAFGLHCVYI